MQVQSTIRTNIVKYVRNSFDDENYIIEQLSKAHNDIEYVRSLPVMSKPAIVKVINRILMGTIVNQNQIVIDMSTKNSRLVLAYLKSILNNVVIEKKAKKDLLLLNAIRSLSDGDIEFMLGAIFKNIAKYILHKYTFTFSTDIGSLYIWRKNRTKNPKFNTKVVDWDKSLMKLNELASTICDDTRLLLKRYKLGVLKKPDYIRLMSQYTYKPDKPDLPKWIEYYTTATNIWLAWSKKSSSISGIEYFSITPTNFINKTVNGSRSQKALAKVMKTDEVIESIGLGFRDKMHIIDRINPNFY